LLKQFLEIALREILSRLHNGCSLSKRVSDGLGCVPPVCCLCPGRFIPRCIQLTPGDPLAFSVETRLRKVDIAPGS